MSVTSNQSGSISTTVGSEVQIGTTITTAGVYVLVTDLNALVNGEVIELRAKTKAKSGGTSRQAFMASFGQVQGSPVKYSVPVPVDTEIIFTIKQVGGSTRSVDWNILSL